MWLGEGVGKGSRLFAPKFTNFVDHPVELQLAFPMWKWVKMNCRELNKLKITKKLVPLVLVHEQRSSPLTENDNVHHAPQLHMERGTVRLPQLKRFPERYLNFAASFTSYSKTRKKKPFKYKQWQESCLFVSKYQNYLLLPLKWSVHGTCIPSHPISLFLVI